MECRTVRSSAHPRSLNRLSKVTTPLTDPPVDLLAASTAFSASGASEGSSPRSCQRLQQPASDGNIIGDAVEPFQRFGPPITRQVRPAQRLGRRSDAQVTRRRGSRRTAFGAQRRRADDRDPGERPQSTAAHRFAPYRRARSRERFETRHRRPPLGQIERFHAFCATFARDLPGVARRQNFGYGPPTKDALEGAGPNWAPGGA